MLNLSGLLDLLRAAPPYRAALDHLRAAPADSTPLNLNVPRSARPFTLAALARDWTALHGAPVVFITARIDRAYNVAEQLPVWIDDPNRIHRFGEPAPFFYERAPWGESAWRTRIAALAALLAADAGGVQPLIVSSARAVMQRTLPVSQFRAGTQTLTRGTRHDPNKLLQAWLGVGYLPASMVVEAGTFSRRGGIIDIFPVTASQPVRIEFFDDEIESLRAFDPATQRSTERLTSLTITPAREAFPAQTPPLAAQLSAWFTALAERPPDPLNPQGDAAMLESGTAFPYLEHYLPYLYPDSISLLDYAPSDALIVVDDWGELRDTAADIDERAVNARADGIASGWLPPDPPAPYLNWESLGAAFAGRQVVTLGGFESSGIETTGVANLRAIFAPKNRFGGQLRAFLTHVRSLRGTGDRTIIVSAQINRIAEVWHEGEAFGTALTDQIAMPPERGSVAFVDGAMQEGWRFRLTDSPLPDAPPPGETHIFTDAEIFGWSRPEPRRRKAARRPAPPEIAYADLKPGDYVVHVDYGIGRFAGMRRRTLEGIEREYLLVEYGGTDSLYIPIHQTDRLTRYVGADDAPPTLHRLGQQDWLRVRGRVKKAVEEEANDLLALYAERASAPGHAFSPDTSWQHELEASFPFVETDDQLRAVRAVKTDMEQPHPMDRLICGDVGYGKTEVALRAAFKAVNDGKQVALLVPTTILAQQHYETFTRRMGAFPVRIELLSRFRTAQEQNRALEKLASGEIDLMVGTHRLLSTDVKFKDLGLIIVDEEQRFGVKHKEHLKRMRAAVDVLTLTATPIPRTLFMSLTGVRDISMIQTPPEERLPILTHVGAFDENIVRQAVLRELERGGQIFVVHNRIQTIDSIRERFQQIVPEARVVIAHGQMEGRLLESIMTGFGNGEYDMLLSTSIIENGLDIPNANTLIVDRADLFGLSQLYQLRGRVGRGAQQGYAYFFHPPSNRLTDEARTRLETLAAYTDLGSGYQIAMRDLELRGAGDILSTRQTGHVAAIGFHLYTQMLASAVQKLKQERGFATSDADENPLPSISENSVVIELPFPAYLPVEYIPDISQRLQIYRRIGGLTDLREVDAIRDELVDRFGALPPAVDGLLYQIRVKILAQTAGATGVIAIRDRIEIRLPYLPEVNRDLLEVRLAIGKTGERVRVTRTAVELRAMADEPNGRTPRDMTGERERLDLTLTKLAEWARAIGVGAGRGA
jgi:transcription-repair coupling factor (superfamily II helicase)